MKKPQYYFIFALFLLTITSCKDKHVRNDMIKFDRAFIPVFYYASIGELSAAEKAMYPLISRWQHYQSPAHFVNKESKNWDETVRLIGAWLEGANCALQEKDAYRALIQLDHARYELADLRFRSGIEDYYLDYVWDLEVSMYMVIDVSNDQMIDLLEFNEFEMLGEELEKAWVNVLNSSYDKGLIECTPDELRYVNYQKEKFSIALVALFESIDAADRCKFADAALALEPAYLNFMAMFGDFDSTESFYALKK